MLIINHSKSGFKYKAFIGDGTVITGSPQTTHYGIPIARKGDKVVCKKCKKVVTIITGDPSYIVDGAPVARAGDMTSCGSKLIASQQAFSESGFDVGSIAQAEPLQFAKSDSASFFSLEDKAVSKYKKKILFEDEYGDPYSNSPYIAFFPNTQELREGTTDEQGYTEEFITDEPEEIVVHLITEDEIEQWKTLY
ncbi:MAG: PAAR domain-containing protein [Psychrobacter sp.]